MRRSIVVAIIFCLLVYSCKKNDSNPVPVTSGPITISSILPVMPYADDEITITGNGFNPDKTKDTVDFGGGDPVSGIFNPYAQGQGTSGKAEVISASATQLVIKATNPDSSVTNGLDYQLFKRLNLGLNLSNRIRVRSNGLQAMSNITPFKQLPDMSIETVANGGGWQPFGGLNWMTPNDSVSVFLYGVNSSNACESKVSLSCGKSSCSFVDNYLTINGFSPQCECDDFGATVYGCAGTLFQGKLVSYNANNHLANVHFLIPANFFGTAVNAASSAGIRIKMKVVNADGKSKTLLAMCMVYPNH